LLIYYADGFRFVPFWNCAGPESTASVRKQVPPPPENSI
jgi:hypothetical protein